jgi:hypothetical protein
MAVNGQVARGEDQVEFLVVLALVRGDLAAGPDLYDGEAQLGLLAGG